MKFIAPFLWSFVLLVTPISTDIIAPGERQSEARTFPHGWPSAQPIPISLPVAAPKPCDIAPAPVASIPVHAPTAPVHTPTVPVHAPTGVAVIQTIAKPVYSYQPQIVQRPTQLVSQQIEHRPIVTEFQHIYRRPVFAEVQEIVHKPIFTEYQQSIKLPTYTQHVLKKPFYTAVSEESIQTPLILAGERYHISKPPSGQIFQLPTQYVQPYSSKVIRVPIIQHQLETQTILTPAAPVVPVAVAPTAPVNVAPAAPVATLPAVTASIPSHVNQEFSYLTPSTCKAGENCEIAKANEDRDHLIRSSVAAPAIYQYSNAMQEPAAFVLRPAYNYEASVNYYPFVRNTDDERHSQTEVKDMNAANGKPQPMTGYAAPWPLFNRPAGYYSVPITTPFVNAQPYYRQPAGYQMRRNQLESQSAETAKSTDNNDNQPATATQYVSPSLITYSASPVSHIVDPLQFWYPSQATESMMGEKNVDNLEGESKSISENRESSDNRFSASNGESKEFDHEAAMASFSEAMANVLSPNSKFWENMLRHYSRLTEKPQDIDRMKDETRAEEKIDEEKKSSFDKIRDIRNWVNTKLKDDERALLLSILNLSPNDQKANMNNESKIENKMTAKEKVSS